MKNMKSTTGVLTVLAVGLLFLTFVQAGGDYAKKTAAADEALICVYNISGADGGAGMFCGGCVNRVKAALLEVDGIASVDAVDLKTGTATVTLTKDSKAKDLIPEAIADAGFLATLRVDDEESEK